MAEPKVARTVSFPVKLYLALEIAADKRGETMTQVILEAVRKDLKLKA